MKQVGLIGFSSSSNIENMKKSKELKLLKELTLDIVGPASNPDRFTDFAECFDIAIQHFEEIESMSEVPF